MSLVLELIPCTACIENPRICQCISAVVMYIFAGDGSRNTLKSIGESDIGNSGGGGVRRKTGVREIMPINGTLNIFQAFQDVLGNDLV